MTQSRHEYVTLLELLINNFSASFTSESFIYSGFSPVPPPLPSPWETVSMDGNSFSATLSIGRLHLSVSYWQLSPPKGSAE